MSEKKANSMKIRLKSIEDSKVVLNWVGVKEF